MKGSKAAMVTESAPTEIEDRKRPAAQATKPRTDTPTINSCLVNDNPVASMTQRLSQPLMKILMCDDDPIDRELVRTCLQRVTDKEIVLLEGRYPEEIQSALDKRRIDLVLIDSQMPGKPGMEWLAQISKERLAPVVMLTGSEAEQKVTQTLQEGALSYFPKGSLSFDKLNDAINVALDGWTRLQQAEADKQELERLAIFDSLTGLFNRQAILGKLRELTSLANRYKEDFSLIMLDIDCFRKVNESYGHLTGDDVLEKIAALIRGNIRDTDVAGRYEGEEFIIVLPRTDLSSSWVAAERLRSIIQETELKDPGGKAFAVTVSQGLVGWERSDDAASLISRADEALYKAKQRGRNRVQILLGPSLRDKI
jgi:two-component system cell cycle response regulator